MRIFLDANVLFSASNNKSRIGELVFLLIDKGYAFTSDLALEETSRNLLLKRAEWIAAFTSLRERIIKVQTIHFDIQVTLDAKDIPLLCAAIHARCDYFVTGDKYDFGHLYGKKIEGIEIITVKRLTELFAENT
jgi:predicted nucleic acid-binding protein